MEILLYIFLTSYIVYLEKTYANFDVPNPFIYSRNTEYGKNVSPIFSTLKGSPSSVEPWKNNDEFNQLFIIFFLFQFYIVDDDMIYNHKLNDFNTLALHCIENNYVLLSQRRKCPNDRT